VIYVIIINVSLRRKKINIFYLHNDPKVCAEMHNNKHVVKMVVEQIQLLSTAHRILDGIQVAGKSKTGRNVKRWILENKELDSILYSATHQNHPSAVWVRQSKANYIWLTKMTLALCKEYTYRYGKVHKVETSGLLHVLIENNPQNISNGPFTEPTPAMPDECKVSGDSISSYRNYYIKHKQHLASWQGKINSRKTPQWFII